MQNTRVSGKNEIYYQSKRKFSRMYSFIFEFLNNYQKCRFIKYSKLKILFGPAEI